MQNMTITFQSQEFKNEINNLSNYLQADTRDVILFAVTYELYAACTSIIAVNNKGKIIFGRNVDYFTAKFMNQLVYDIDFYKKIMNYSIPILL